MNTSTTYRQKQTLLSKLGPGLLYAGAAVGVSHLVQSTRAGGGVWFLFNPCDHHYSFH